MTTCLARTSLAALALLACTTAHAFSQTNGEAPPAVAEPEAPPAQNWVVDCTGDPATRRCTMLQNLVSTEGDGQQRVLTVLVQPDVSGTETLQLALPHGLFLPAGVQVGVDANPAQKLVIQTSDQNGAYAGTTLTPELLAALRTGTELRVSFQSSQQKDLAVPVTLQGFATGYDQTKLGITGR